MLEKSSASVGKNAFDFGRENVKYNVVGTIENLTNALGETKIVNA